MQSFLQWNHLRQVVSIQLKADKRAARKSITSRNVAPCPHQQPFDTLLNDTLSCNEGSSSTDRITYHIGEVEINRSDDQDGAAKESGSAPNGSDSDVNVFVVSSTGSDDLVEAKNWPYSYRIRATAIIWLLVFALGWSSTCDSNSTRPASKEFRISEETATLATALFLVGISLGSLFAGPISETIGRNPAYLLSVAIFLCFSLASGLATNFGGLLAFRFLAGLASSPTLSMYGGSLADMFEAEERHLVWAWFATGPVLGPVLSPLASAWIIDFTSWRWVYWVSLIFSGVAFIVALFFLPETFSPVLQGYKVQQLRSITGDDRYVSPAESKDPFVLRLKENLSRPGAFFTTEPIIIFLGLYLVVIYIINFSFLNGFSSIFEQTYGLSNGIASLAFISITIGCLFNTALTPVNQRLHRYLFLRHQNLHKDSSECGSPSEEIMSQVRSSPPELLLAPAAIAAPFLPLSLFWLGWTNYASIFPISGYMATALFGYALTAIFVSSYRYIIDSYEKYSSSALASITVVRYVASGAMVVVTMPMYKKLGVHWTTTLLGSLALLLVPVPWILWRYGSKIRGRSAYAKRD